MSTRCNVLIKDQYDEQWFYRHSDGYPSCTATSLKTFVQWLVDGRIRDTVIQGAGWLIILGNAEYAKNDSGFNKEPAIEGHSGWQVGAYEITQGQHGDIEHLYTIDMAAKTVTVDEDVYSYEEFLNKDFTKG